MLPPLTYSDFSFAYELFPTLQHFTITASWIESSFCSFSGGNPVIYQSALKVCNLTIFCCFPCADLLICISIQSRRLRSSSLFNEWKIFSFQIPLSQTCAVSCGEDEHHNNLCVSMLCPPTSFWIIDIPKLGSAGSPTRRLPYGRVFRGKYYGKKFQAFTESIYQVLPDIFL